MEGFELLVSNLQQNKYVHVHYFSATAATHMRLHGGHADYNNPFKCLYPGCDRTFSASDHRSISHGI